MGKYRIIKTAIGIETAALIIGTSILGINEIREKEAYGRPEPASGTIFAEESDTSAGTDSENKKKDYIKWVDFDVTAEAMKQAYQYDVDTYGAKIHLDWIDLLAILGAKYGGDFKGYQAGDLDRIAEKFLSGERTMEDVTKDMKYFSYYREAYGAVLGGMVGEYQIQCAADAGSGTEDTAEESADGSSRENSDSKKPADSSDHWKSCYGLKAFSPIAKGFPYSDFDDFGVARSYGYRRSHLGHDMMGQVGTPIISVESGKVTALGWNQYGGWRIGIESFDGKRYYYYAHLRQNRPYAEGLKEGDIVQAGDVIGYMGRTGYSKKENVNNIDESHLHFGLQLIFDESQREGSGEIWVSAYELVRFLSGNRSEVIRNDDTKEWKRVYQIQDPAVPASPTQ